MTDTSLSIDVVDDQELEQVGSVRRCREAAIRLDEVCSRRCHYVIEYNSTCHSADDKSEAIRKDG